MSTSTIFTERALLREMHARLDELVAVSPGLTYSLTYNPFPVLGMEEAHTWTLRLNDGKGLMLSLPAGNVGECIDKATALFVNLGLL